MKSPTQPIRMMPVTEEVSLPDFEIDHPREFAQFLLSSRRDVLFYLDQLIKRRSLFTAYINQGQQFFLTIIVAFDESAGMLFLEPEPAEENNAGAGARQITLVANLDRIKMQIRLPALQTVSYQGRTILAAPIPEAILRLQRREFFRLEPPLAQPIHCKLATSGAAGTPLIFEMALSDISGGGLCLIGPVEHAEHFPRDALFQHCRLEIPGEGVIQVNLRVRKTIEMSDRSGGHSQRIGCEFVNLPSARLAFIERYITRIERERKARSSGLAD